MSKTVTTQKDYTLFRIVVSLNESKLAIDTYVHFCRARRITAMECRDSNILDVESYRTSAYDASETHIANKVKEQLMALDFGSKRFAGDVLGRSSLMMRLSDCIAEIAFGALTLRRGGVTEVFCDEEYGLLAVHNRGLDISFE